MAHREIEIDEEACAVVMRRYGLKTKREAINFALRMVSIEPLTVDEARKLRGSGWRGNLEAMRARRTMPS